MGPLLLGTAVAAFFTGANFVVNRDALTSLGGSVIVSQWQIDPLTGLQLHGLEALWNPWNLVLGLAVLFLSRVSGLLYFINNIIEPSVNKDARKGFSPMSLLFWFLHLAFLGYLLMKDGFAVHPESGEVFMAPHKYWHNLIEKATLSTSGTSS